jgi:hypothetical protein
MIQIESASAPFTSPQIAFQAVTALARADAMGLLPAEAHIETLDLSSFRKAVRHIHRAGIARNIQFEFADFSAPDLERSLECLNLGSRNRQFLSSNGIDWGKCLAWTC